jgi:hypothetical protein
MGGFATKGKVDATGVVGAAGTARTPVTESVICVSVALTVTEKVPAAFNAGLLNRHCVFVASSATAKPGFDGVTDTNVQAVSGAFPTVSPPCVVPMFVASGCDSGATP